MKRKVFFAWLMIPFAVAAASDCGAPLGALALIAFAWAASAVVCFKSYQSRMEQKRQHELNRRMRRCPR